ncbi:MAG: RdgB/HAM1 family non-canonical purine NTP pyrophosphatase [Calditrichia bacterium]|nr:RdgB/HAM1 family non-canonical purine NTP pyrophosphatase [Calditrichia bacterium]
MKKIIYIATKNEHKVAEIKPILKNLNVNLKSISVYDNIPDAVEDGITFEENAKLKAEHYFKYLKKPVIADDSGLVVPALNGEPGIYSARYAGEKSNYALNNQKLLKKMEHLSGNDRYAYFICSVIYKDENCVLFAEGKCEGQIIIEEKGAKGFGYDPIFEYPELKKTFAQIEAKVKNKISHRYLAFNQLSKILNEYWKSVDN